MVEVHRRDDVTVEIDPDAGGRVAAVRVGDLDLLVGRTGDPLAWGCYPMVPWAGRVRHGRLVWDGVEHALEIDHPPHAIHGVGYRSRWEAVAPGVCELALDWPLGGRARSEVRLVEGGLDLVLSVHSDGPAVPCALGWHPWFRRALGRGEPVTLANPAGRMWRRDGEGIPDGTLVEPAPGPWDDCFTDLRGPATLTWPGALTLTISAGCAHRTVFDQLDDAVCVEPQTAPPDCFALGVDVLVAEPGRPAVARSAWRWTRLA